MSVLRKIILTVVLVVLLLFVQSYVFSDSCSLIVSSPSLKTIPFGCVGDECSFILFNSSDATSPSLETCLEDCSNSYNTVECAQACVSEYVPSPTDMILNNNLSFTKSSCQENTKVNLLLGSNLNMEMKNTTTSLSISGIDSLNTNGKNIDIFVNNNDKLGDATFRFDFSNLLVSNTSKITMSTKERTSQADSINGGYGDWKRDGIKFYFNNLEITEGSSLDLNMYIPKNILNVEDNIGMPITSLAGGELTFDGNSVVNNGNFNINLRAQDSQDGRSFNNQGVGWENPDGTGGTVKEAGHVFFNLNYLENNGLLASEIFSGNGGIGGNGSRSGTNRKTPGYGGKGGDAGSIFFYIDYIDNHSNLDFNLVSGDGGHGGNTGFDNGGPPTSDYAEGGDGGNGGHIYFCKSIWNNGFECMEDTYNSLINKGNLNINALTGKGNNGGVKKNHPEDGKAGDGGNGGSFLSDLKINYLDNQGIINLNLESNIYGLKGTTPGGVNGVSGVTKNVFIDYLSNKTNNFNLVVDSKKLPSQNESDIIISKLQTGSYLPSKIYTTSNITTSNGPDPVCLEECSIDYCSQGEQLDCSFECSGCGDPETCDDCFNDCEAQNENISCQEPQYSSCADSCQVMDYSQGNTTNRQIRINDACYIKQPSQPLDYLSGSISVNLTNQGDIQNFLPSTTNYTQNTECSICDYYDFESINLFPTGSANKFSQTYTLFSSKQGVIPANNLKIYYAKNNSTFTKINALYNPFTKENNLPLYTNKAPITGVLNEKLNLYEYKINLNNLEWYYDKEMDLTGKDIFCYYQNYRIEGSIDGTSFNFPFTPLFKN